MILTTLNSGKKIWRLLNLSSCIEELLFHIVITDHEAFPRSKEVFWKDIYDFENSSSKLWGQLLVDQTWLQQSFVEGPNKDYIHFQREIIMKSDTQWRFLKNFCQEPQTNRQISIKIDLKHPRTKCTHYLILFNWRDTSISRER